MCCLGGPFNCIESTKKEPPHQGEKKSKQLYIIYVYVYMYVCNVMYVYVVNQKHWYLHAPNKNEPSFHHSLLGSMAWHT